MKTLPENFSGAEFPAPRSHFVKSEQAATRPAAGQRDAISRPRDRADVFPSTFSTRFAGRPWAMEGRAFAALMTSLKSGANASSRGSDRGARSEAWTLDDWREYWSDIVLQRKPTAIDPASNLAVLDVRGVLLDNEAPAWIGYLGATTYAEIRADIAALRSRAVKGVLLTVDSPGGMCSGCTEAATAIAELARDVPVVAHVQGLCASAGYFLAAGVSEIWAEPSAQVGCIGTILPMLDWSGFWEEMGVRDDYITNTGGDLKAAYYPPSRTPEERAQLQQEIDDCYEQFRDHVLAHRAIPPEAMRGQCFSAPRALEVNLIDRIGPRTEAFARFRAMV